MRSILVIFFVLFAIILKSNINYNIPFKNYIDTIPSDTNYIPFSKFINYLDSLQNLWCYSKSEKILLNNGKTALKISEKEYNRKINSLKLSIKFTYNSHIKRYLDKYLIEKREQTGIMLGIFKNYEPYFTKAIKDNQLPEELKYLPLAQSSMFYRAKSESGGAGFWQQAFSSGRHYNLEINSFIDERKDMLKATEAAISHLNDLYNIYNDWLLAIAAYNTSPTTVNKAVRKAKGAMNFWSIYEFLPEDSRDYVPAYLACVFVANFHKDFNLTPANIQIPKNADTVTVNKFLHFKQVGKILDIPLSQIKEMNPIYRNYIIPDNDKGYKLLLPQGYAKKFLLLKDSIYKYKDSSFISFVKFENYGSMPTEDEIVPVTEIYYIVKPNDNLQKIARKYGVTVTDIRKWNRLRSKTIRRGQKLKILFETKEKPKTTTVKKQISDANAKIKTDTLKTISADTLKVKKISDTLIYKVKPGDSYYKIAKKHNITMQQLLDMNNMRKEQVIKPGQKLKIIRK